MNYFLKILRFFYSIWNVASFLILTIPMMFGYLLLKFVPYPKQIVGVYYINRFFIFIWSAFVGFRYKIKGLENIDKNQTYIVVANHVNASDLMAISYGLRVYAKPLIKKELTYVPGLGQLFSLMCIPVDRSSKEARHQSKMRMLDDLKKGISIFLFPEGTRNRTKQPLLPFYDGAFELSIESKLPILPVMLTNLRKINRVDTLLLQPGILEVTHLPPIYPKDYTLEKMEAYKNEVRNIMEKFLIENDTYFQDYNQ